jgi:hypothetical protein
MNNTTIREQFGEKSLIDHRRIGTYVFANGGTGIASFLAPF